MDKKFNEILWFKSVREMIEAGFDADINRQCILEEIEIKTLFRLLNDGNREVFSDKSVWEYYFSKIKIDNLEALIKERKKITPPKVIFTNNGLVIEDGRHRIRVSLERNLKHIPILISAKDMYPICSLLYVSEKGKH